MNELHRLRNSGIRVILQAYLPPNTMIVSQDVWDALKASTKPKETIEGEVVKEARKQLEGGDGG
jgi:hypothetical protein